MRRQIRASIDRRIQASKRKTPGEIDIVQTVARYVPVDVVEKYLGIPSYNTNQISFDDVLKGGQEFDIDPALKSVFQFQHISRGKIPTEYDMYVWVRDAFRNIFNNVGRNESFERDGIKATEYLLAYIHKVQMHYKAILSADPSKRVPDTMLTRLIKMQMDVSSNSDLASELSFSSNDELKLRLADSRIRANVFGTVVGAIANPEEANARIVRQAVRFRKGELLVRAGQKDYAHFASLAEKNAKDDDGVRGANDEFMKDINTLSLELLRLDPQGEVLLRECVAPVDVGGQTLVPQVNKVVFVAHGAAMRDPTVVIEPEKLSTERVQGVQAYSSSDDKRENDDPHSSIYLQHGFGRHKCLGRYASELTMEEVLRATLLLKNPEVKGDLRMDIFNLYAESLIVTYDG